MKISEAPPKATESIEQFARKVFTEIHQSIVVQEPAALNGDIEAIHDMRVAIRRLRVALSNFEVCLSRQDQRRLRAELENLAEALGKVRDLDVMITALEFKRSTYPAEDHKAINSFIERLQRLRRRQHRRLVNYLQSEHYANFKREFSSAGQLHMSDQEEHGQAA